MARITDIELCNVRCFEGAQSAHMGRITLLVGENGAGKSTFLGCYKAIAKLANLYDLEETNHFDDPPLHMGSFESIVRKGKTEFIIGAKFDNHCHNSISFAFRADGHLPVDHRVKLTYPGPEGPGGVLDMTISDGPAVFLQMRESGFEFDLLAGEISFRSISTWLSRYVRHGYFPFNGQRDEFERQTGESRSSNRYVQFVKFSNWMRRKSGELFPARSTFATEAPDPVTPPRLRSYESVPEYLDANGDIGLFNFLSEMGRSTGLWTDIRVEPASNGRGVKVLVETPGGLHNLVDVGYGVHGLLPMLSAFHRLPPNTVFLLQQPEIHIHPRAQAELAQWMASSERHFVIETHSDHFVNRFRICVMKEVLKPEDLSIVYFEPSRDGTESQIHSISVDAQGNFLGEPRGYRSFFLEEDERLLGFR